MVQPDLLSAVGADDVIKFDDPNVANLLKEFHDVFPDELPSQLPPDKGVTHAIPIPDGQVPPVKPIYRLSPVEREEVTKTLQELSAFGAPETHLSGRP